MRYTADSLDTEREALERALASKRGIAMTFLSYKEAFHFRAKCYALRKLDREASKHQFDPGNQAWGRSPYDSLRLSIEENRLLITPNSAAAATVEEL